MKPTDPAVLEICCESPAGVAAAIAGGADRIELCSALAIGGLTPSAGLVGAARAATQAAGIALYAMVRPRGGDFAYDASDLALALGEARTLIAQGIDGLVFGAVRGGAVDDDANRRFLDGVRDAAGWRLPCTFHRAIDVIADAVGAVAHVAALGFDQILTSGGARRAPDGAATIRAMVAAADGTGVSVMAGAGVTPDTAIALLADTGVRALHASASVAGGAPHPRFVELGFALGPERHTDVATVRALRSALDNLPTIGH
ncbi:MAG: copper homeostasis protein CutC [Pseudomonadota bacterium]